MYPNLYYAFRDLFGIELEGLKIVNSFGFFVALAFLAAAYTLTLELKRKQQAGLLTFKEEKILVGKPAGIGELLLNAVLGFFIGFKIIGALLDKAALADTQAFIFSGEGNWLAGIGVALFFAGLKWWEKNKTKLAKPEERTIRIWPHDRVGDLVIYAAVFGFVGAKLFDNLENPARFFADPIGSMLSASGFTFYGGLICAAIAIMWYARKNNIGILHLADAVAPGLMLAYGVGRIGCQVSGDGDWGIINNNPKPFSWLPDWMWAYNYPHNVNRDGIPIPGCDWGDFCMALPDMHYPTPLYESIAAILIFVGLWLFRKQMKVAGMMFGAYLIVNGVERFLIEKIRVNNRYDVSTGFQPTQAEIISTLLVIGGAIFIWLLKRKAKTAKH